MVVVGAVGGEWCWWEEVRGERVSVSGSRGVGRRVLFLAFGRRLLSERGMLLFVLSVPSTPKTAIRSSDIDTRDHRGCYLKIKSQSKSRSSAGISEGTLSTYLADHKSFLARSVSRPIRLSSCVTPSNPCCL